MSTTGTLNDNDVVVYPTREEHNRAWEELAREIAANRNTLSENPEPVEKDKQGSLIIVGSGIQGIGFTFEAEAYLKAADKVFYCVSNPPTQVWLRKLRPDAYDLYVLYDDTKPRYHTYMQMTDAMLHYVRQGKRVVCVYYGHPGIFVLSTHRAIAIARREGHYAVMKPGISALDCLCADLGIDPAYPGMQTYEASEVLLRKRQLDATNHVILWQVGLIGEQGYRRKGFINDKFPILIEYLQKIYGEDYEIIHYIAARHATFEPTIAVHKLSEMLNPRVRSTFTGISTFYIPPKEAAQTDQEMAIRLGFITEPGQKLKKLEPTRDFARYSSRELKAIEEFENFHVPNEYQFQPITRAGEFLVELNSNVALQDLYRANPKQALSDDSFPGLSDVERHLLTSRDENHAQVAAKGSLVPFSVNEQFIIDMFTNMDLTSSFRAMLVDNYKRDDARQVFNDWVSSKGYKCSIDDYKVANERLMQSLLLPWTGVYSNADGSLILTLVGSSNLNDLSFVSINLTEITGFTFNNSTLIWYAEDGNPNNAKLTFKLPESDGGNEFVRSISGKYWMPDAQEPEEINLYLVEVVPGANPLSSWTAQYETKVTTDGVNWNEGPSIIVTTPLPNQSSNKVQLTIDGEAVDYTKFENNTITWENNRISFTSDIQSKGRKLLTGFLEGCWADGENLKGFSLPNFDTPYQGHYSTSVFNNNRWKAGGDFIFREKMIQLGSQEINNVEFEHNLVRWSDAGGESGNGEIQFFIDPITQLPKFVGYIWGSKKKPKHPNLQGILAYNLIVSPNSDNLLTGNYSTNIRLSDGTFGPDGPFVEINKIDDNNYDVKISAGTTTLEVVNPIFDAEQNVLSWRNQSGTDNLHAFENADLRFDKHDLTGAVVFQGEYWQNDGSPDESENWHGYALGLRLPTSADDGLLPPPVHKVLEKITLEGNNPVSSFIWSNWQRSRFAFRLTNSLVPKIFQFVGINKS